MDYFASIIPTGEALNLETTPPVKASVTELPRSTVRFPIMLRQQRIRATLLLEGYLMVEAPSAVSTIPELLSRTVIQHLPEEVIYHVDCFVNIYKVEMSTL